MEVSPRKDGAIGSLYHGFSGGSSGSMSTPGHMLPLFNQDTVQVQVLGLDIPPTCTRTLAIYCCLVIGQSVHLSICIFYIRSAKKNTYIHIYTYTLYIYIWVCVVLPCQFFSLCRRWGLGEPYPRIIPRTILPSHTPSHAP